MEVKKKEPVLYKKYTNTKTASDAKSLLTTIRQKIQSMQYLELMTFNKSMEYKHGLKRDPVKKAFGQISQKDKANRFGHLNESFQIAMKNVQNSTSDNKSKNQETPTYATVTIETVPISTPLQEMTPLLASSPPPAPPLPPHMAQFSPLIPRHETFL